MTTFPVSIIQNSTIRSLNIAPATCVKWVEDGFRMKDEAQMPAKLSVHPQGEDFITSMPCLLPEKDGKQYFGLKVVSRIAGQIPNLHSEIYLYNSQNGHLLSILDGDWITAMRTGAVAALAARTFKRADVNTYSMIGLGNIGIAVGACLIDDNKDRNITIRLMRYKNQAEQFIEKFSYAQNVNFEIIDSHEEFFKEADVIISSVTVAPELLCPDNSWFKKGVTLIPVHVRGFQNCDLFFDKVFGDDTGQIQTWKYYSQFRQYNEIHKVITAAIPGRTNDEERILSYNYGIALHDIVFATKIYEEFQSQNLPKLMLEKEDAKTWL